jgi:phenylacetate-coenzyme A ligase PaaK-like adenylate-forming protein
VTTWVLLGFTAINLGLIGLTFQISESMKQEMGEAARNIVRITSEIQTQTGRHVERIESVQRPVVAVDPSQHKTFELVRRELETGEYETARLRLYSLLAVADRLDGEVRSDVEARAQYMLADIALAQALAASDAGKSGEGLP